MTNHLKVGEDVPPFLAKDHDGYDMTDEVLIGNPSVLMFLPSIHDKDGLHLLKVCQHNIGKFKEYRALIYVFAPEDFSELKEVHKKNHFEFTLVSDVIKRTYQRFGLEEDGKIVSATYLVNSDGVIKWIERPIKPDKHIPRIFHEIKIMAQV